MKTSYMLLALIVLVTLMGMTATNVLLKQEYDKLDWSNLIQGFEQRKLPTVRHWVIDGELFDEMIIEQGGQPEVFVRPTLSQFCNIQLQGDTAYISSLSNENTARTDHSSEWEDKVGLVIHVPDLSSVKMKNGYMTIRKFALDSLKVSLANSRLRTSELVVKGNYTLDVCQHSKSILGADQYGSLRVAVRDSSIIRMRHTQVNKLVLDPSPKAEVELSGRALQWLKKL